jgi:hypothetical protein
MRSGGNFSTMSNNTLKSKSVDDDDDDGEGKTTQTSKCKGATTIPIFLKSKCQVSKSERLPMRIEDVPSVKVHNTRCWPRSFSSIADENASKRQHCLNSALCSLSDLFAIRLSSTETYKIYHVQSRHCLM